MIQGETEVISKIVIKPSIPTPHHLKTHKICLLDQVYPNLHCTMTIIYDKISTVTPSSNDSDCIMSAFLARSQLLQTSLSQTLSHFYPFAGRFQDDATILCNDEGVVFFEAKTEIYLSHLLSLSDFEAIGSNFLRASDDFEKRKQMQRPMMLIGFTLFGCGSTALSICVTHKIADLASLLTLLKSWSAASTGAKQIVKPDLSIAASLMPPRDISGMSECVILSTKKIASTRLVFSAPKIAELKAKVLSGFNSDHELQQYPSRADLALALIWKCAMTAFMQQQHTGGFKFKPTVLMQAANLRTRTEPPLPENSMGNLAWTFPLIVEDESEMEVKDIVNKMLALKASLKNKGKRFGSEKVAEAVKEGLYEREQLLKNKDLVVYLSSNWCKFPMLELDFGWGRPLWVTAIEKAILMGNSILLLDTKVAGEVEALVHLEEAEMDAFQHNAELLQYASINPTII